MLLLLMALLLFKLELNESKVSLGMNAVYVLSCFFGGLAAGKGGKKSHFLRGGSVGGKNAEHGGKQVDRLLRLPLRVANSRHSRQVAQMAGKVPGVRAKLPVGVSACDGSWREKLHQ